MARPSPIETDRIYRAALLIIAREENYWAGLVPWRDVAVRHGFDGLPNTTLFAIQGAVRWIRECLSRDIRVTAAQLHELGLHKTYRIWKLWCKDPVKTDLRPEAWVGVTVSEMDSSLSALDENPSIEVINRKIAKIRAEASAKIAALVKRRELFGRHK